MTHALLVALALVPAPRADVAPERLLSPTTQVYYRWDGVAAHKEAYRKSARGQMLEGDTGKFLASVYDRLVRTGVQGLFGEPLLAGGDPDELAARHADYRLAIKLPQLLSDTGIVVGFEVRPPALRLEQFGRLFGLGGEPSKSDALLVPDLQLTVIVPNAADRPEWAALARLALPGAKREEVRHRGRVAQAVEIDEVRFAWWAEGKHFVLTVGSVPTRTAIDRMASAGDGVTAHPLYKALNQKQKFEVVSRAYADGASLWRVARLLLAGSGNGRYAPLLDLTGLTGIQSVRLWDGFDGDESRSVTEVDTSGPREGLTKLYKAGKFDLKDLPPLPADVTRWSAGVFDITAGYDLFLGYVALQDLDSGFKGKTEFLEKRQEFADEIDGLLGMKFGDLLASLGDLGVTYQSPGDGLLAAGQVFAMKVRDERAFKRLFPQFVAGLEKVGRDDIKVTRRTYQGVETREFALQGGDGIIRPTVAVCDGWMVWAFYPQPVHGFILRSKGKLPPWKPDERTAKALAAMPPGPAAVQYSDPRATVKLLFAGAQPVVGYLSSQKEWRDVFDVGLLPHPEEACRPLFPNLLWTHNDGKTIRWETRESLALPFEVLGIETVIALLAGGRVL